MRAKRMATAYAELNRQRGVADWGYDDVFQFLIGEGLTDDEARSLTDDCRTPEEKMDTTKDVIDKHRANLERQATEAVKAVAELKALINNEDVDDDEALYKSVRTIREFLKSYNDETATVAAAFEEVERWYAWDDEPISDKPISRGDER